MSGPRAKVQSTHEFVAGLRTIWMALLAGLLTFLGVGAAVGPIAAEGSQNETLLLIVYGIALLGTSVAAFVLRASFAGKVRARAATLRNMADPLPEIFRDYRALFVVLCGLSEAPALVALVIYLLTHSTLALVGFGVSFLVLLSQAPSEERLRRFVRDATYTAG